MEISLIFANVVAVIVATVAAGDAIPVVAVTVTVTADTDCFVVVVVVSAVAVAWMLRRVYVDVGKTKIISPLCVSVKEKI